MNSYSKMRATRKTLQPGFVIFRPRLRCCTRMDPLSAGHRVQSSIRTPGARATGDSRWQQTHFFGNALLSFFCIFPLRSAFVKHTFAMELRAF